MKHFPSNLRITDVTNLTQRDRIALRACAHQIKAAREADRYIHIEHGDTLLTVQPIGRVTKAIGRTGLNYTSVCWVEVPDSLSSHVGPTPERTGFARYYVDL